MENIIFNLAYILGLLFCVAVVASIVATVWNLLGFNHESSNNKHTTNNWLKHFRNVSNKSSKAVS